MTRPRAFAALAALALLGSGTLAACGGDDETPELTPEERLAAAKTTLDETEGVRIALKADELPPSVNGLLTADGVGTHAPAFEGDIQVSASGLTAKAKVIAVDGKVWAVLPFTTDYAPIDPADYSAPDPAALMAADGGLSSLLTAADSVEEGEQVREGEEVLTEITGTLPGDAVASVIPSAQADADFDATFTLDDGNQLSEVTMTGPFYPKAADVTYTIRFSEYGVEKEITAP
ncbi:LppX_LprAFG lipoprotein [Nocardioides iriomotensis]|uniref:LppX_LprAFG lipoprotein n=1 Tax=Nocardioides iriomotensis TaxID=715784 RepID=A0A4Q5J3I7_9ACTN|nr:LppX_LprAFG lipoprotein [Nocardioides iriomotensis]RYU11945.1 LppX_LprAFG lipoprotein [Nocardioides iriomotensis]